jgi:hypothetical protein
MLYCKSFVLTFAIVGTEAFKQSFNQQMEMVLSVNLPVGIIFYHALF